MFSFFQDALFGEGITVFIVSDAYEGEKLHGEQKTGLVRQDVYSIGAELS